MREENTARRQKKGNNSFWDDGLHVKENTTMGSNQCEENKFCVGIQSENSVQSYLKILLEGISHLVEQWKCWLGTSQVTGSSL